MHRMPEALRAQPDIHTGYTSLADVMECRPFRKLYADWKLPSGRLVKQDEILLKVQHALTQVPNRDQVTEELENGLLQTTPSYEVFVHSIGHRSGDAAGSMQGLTYAMMKA